MPLVPPIRFCTLDVQIGKIPNPFNEFPDKTAKTPYQTRLRSMRLTGQHSLEWSLGQALGPLLVQSWCSQRADSWTWLEPGSNLVISRAGADLPGERVRAFTDCPGFGTSGKVVRRLTEIKSRPVSASTRLARWPFWTSTGTAPILNREWDKRVAGMPRILPANGLDANRPEGFRTASILPHQGQPAPAIVPR